jgi:membrane protein required for colicin V production
MNIFDMVMIAVVCVCLIRGLFRGLSRELASILGILGGFYGAYLFYPHAARRLPAIIPRGAFADLAGFALVFCGIVIAVALVGVLIRYIMGITMMGWLDRLLGGMFGALKGALFVVVLLFFVTSVGGSSLPYAKGSRLYGYVAAMADSMADVVSKGLYKGLYSKVQEIKKQWIK